MEQPRVRKMFLEGGEVGPTMLITVTARKMALKAGTASSQISGGRHDAPAPRVPVGRWAGQAG